LFLKQVEEQAEKAKAEKEAAGVGEAKPEGEEAA